MNKFLLSIVALILSTSSLFAQEPCATDFMLQQVLEDQPEKQQVIDRLQAFTEAYIADNPYEGPESGTEPTYVIPVVFHIMHDYTNASNIPKRNVLDAMRILNEDFRAENSDTNLIVSEFKQRIGGMNVEFRLATKDPQGNCTDGITRTYTEMTNNGGENVKGLISWDTKKYYNIWVVKSIGSGGSGGTTLGYAFKPGTAPTDAQEGVIIRANCVGSFAPGGVFGNQGLRTLTHETGHWLNLSHTWGDGAIATACGSDLVYDTPKTQGTPSGCPSGKNSCVDDTTDFYGYDIVDNLQNHMEYTNCNRMFTIGQAERMEAALNSFNGFRKLLWAEANLVATGTDSAAGVTACTMVPDFGASKTVVCPGTNVSLTDLSWNGNADTRTWTVTGPATANMSSTSDSSVTVSFTTPGEYTVKLELTNAAGTVSLEKTAFIGVMNDVATYSNWHMETFEGSTSLPAGYLSSSSGPNTFEVTSDAGWYTSDNSLWLNNYNNQSGDISNVVLPSVAVPNTTSPVLSFQYAFAKRTSSSNDKLEIYVSTNCGATWIKRLTIGTNDLSSAPTSALQQFFPKTISEWKVGELDLSSYKSASKVAIRFQFNSGGGNNFFVDNINMRDGVVSISEFYQPTDLMLMPNPVQNQARLSFGLKADAELDIKIVNLTGQVVKDYGLVSFDEGENNFEIETLSNLPAGVYLVKLDGNFGSMQKRFVISQ